MASALLATTALGIGGGTAAPAYAQTARAYNIPAGPLATALSRYIEASSVTLVYDAALTNGLSSPGLQGSFGDAEALSRLLAGSGLTYRQTGPNAYTLERAPTADAGTVQLGPVRVEGQDGTSVPSPPSQAVLGNLPRPYAGGQVAKGQQVGVLGERAMVDTPFNITSYTRQLVQDQQAYSVSDVLANNPSVRIFYPDNDGSTDFFIRGNKVSQLDIAYDGLYGIGTPGIESIERIDVLVGANALLNGLGPIGGVGGMVNQVPKRALDTPLTELTLGYIGGQFGGSVDFSRRVGDEKQFGIRFNGAYRDGDTEADHQSRRVGTATLALDWHNIDDSARLSANVGYRDNENQAPARTTYLLSDTFAIPAPPSNPKANWQNRWSYDNTYTAFGDVRGEVDITPNLTAFAAVGGSSFKEEELFSNTFLLASDGTIGQRQVYWPLYRDSVTAEGGLRGVFHTGPVKHRISLAVSGLHETNGIISTTLATTYSNIYDPVFIAKPNIAGLADASHVPETTRTNLSGIALADTLSVRDESVQLTLGIRHQGVNAKNFDPTSGAATSSYDKGAWTPAFALLVKPWKGLSLYANYIEGLQQGGQAPVGYSNAGEVFAPFVSKQYEVGAKYDFGTFMATLSAYRITTPNAQADGLVYAIDGQQRTKGLELNTYGEIVHGLRLLGGLALIDPRQTHTAGGLYDGKRVNGAARVQLNLGTEWDPAFLPGWTVSGRVNHTGSEYIDAANLQSIPGSTTYDAGLRYKTVIAEHSTAFRFNVENLANKSYWGGGNGFLIEGRPRTFLFSVSFGL